MTHKLLLVIFLILSSQSVFSINPMREYKMKPEKFEIPYEEIKVKTNDGCELNTWIMKSTLSNRRDHIFIIAGSDAGNMGFTLPYVAYLLKKGYDVITFDYRGFGASSDFDFKPDNLYHSEYVTDFVTIVDWVKKDIQPNKIGILAFSMGTLVATAGFNESKYDFLVCEGFIKSPRKNQKRIKKLKGKKLNLPKNAKIDSKKIKKINIPILFFASSLDKISTLKDIKKAANKNPNRKIIEFKGEHLRGAYTLGIENYINEISKMVK